MFELHTFFPATPRHPMFQSFPCCYICLRSVHGRRPLWTRRLRLAASLPPFSRVAGLARARGARETSATHATTYSAYFSNGFVCPIYLDSNQHSAKDAYGIGISLLVALTVVVLVQETQQHFVSAIYTEKRLVRLLPASLHHLLDVLVLQTRLKHRLVN